MAPEQLEGCEADARTDIFAFGAVLYEMLAGKKAFEGTIPAFEATPTPALSKPVDIISKPSAVMFKPILAVG